MLATASSGLPALGVTAGLLSAAFMALSYLMSRHHALGRPPERRPSASWLLLLRSHALMAVVCVPFAAAMWPAEMPAIRDYGPPVVGAAALYLTGNAIFFSLLRRVEASRLIPFLGLKIFILAAIVAFVLGQPLSGRQWIGVGLSIAATAMLQGAAGGLPRQAFALVLATCLCFAVADLCIVRLIDTLAPALGGGAASGDRLRGATLAMLLNYCLCGVASVVGLAVARATGSADDRSPLPGDWRMAALYAVTWLAAMAGLYICFGFTGAVLGNVIQSTRGIMSVAVGAILAHLGWHELEQRVDRLTLLRRLAAAILMTAAIAVSLK